MAFIEGELVSLSDDNKTPDNPADDLTDEQLEQQIKEEQGKLVSDQTEQVIQPLPEPQKAQVEEPKEKVPSGTVQEGETKKTEQEKKQGEVSFEELQEKKGLQSVDELAKSYVELEKSFHKKSQELADLKKKEQFHTPAVTDSYYGETPEESANRLFREKWDRNPIGTLIDVQNIILKPVRDTTRQIELRNEIVRLSSSPQTADFNLPEVQQEIKKIVEENPDKYSENLIDNLEDLYWISKGRLGTRSQGTSQERVTPRTPPVEGTSKPVPEEPFNQWTASEDELLSTIKGLQRQLR